MDVLGSSKKDETSIGWQDAIQLSLTCTPMTLPIQSGQLTRFEYLAQGDSNELAKQLPRRLQEPR